MTAGGAEPREKAERKHNSNRNQLEPSKLFMHQMDTFPQDFTLKCSRSALPLALHCLLGGRRQESR